MKKLFIILGLVTAIIATILSVSKFSNLAVTPIIISFISGLIVLYLSKKEQNKTKTIQYIFLLVIISLSLTIYKGVINSSNVEDIEQLEQQGEENTEKIEEISNQTEID